MRKSKTMRAASFLLVLTLMTSCFVGSTFAKYTSTTTVSDTARVAKWSFEVNDKDIAKSEVFTFDLFSTVNDFGGTSDDADVLNGVNENIIAPGTQGSFQIVLENTSEVTAKYSIDYTVENTNNIPIQFSVNNGANWADDLSDVVASEEGANSTVLAHSDGTTTITIQWEWPFERGENDTEKATNDGGDTALGIGGSATVKVTAKITAEQVD